jgi:hypothetical protein
MFAMRSDTRANASHRLATPLRVRRLAPAAEAALALDHRGPAQIDNETLTVLISDRAEVSLCASA